MAARQWLKDQWNEPDRHDYYLMMVAQRVIQAQMQSNHDKITIGGQRITFEFSRPAAAPALEAETEEQLEYRRKVAASISKAKWFAATGYKS